MEKVRDNFVVADTHVALDLKNLLSVQEGIPMFWLLALIRVICPSSILAVCHHMPEVVTCVFVYVEEGCVTHV
jgi:hypothetical protein